LWGEQSVRFAHGWVEEAEVVVVHVRIASRGKAGGAIALALESGAVAIGIAYRCQRGSRLDLARVERRVDGHEGETAPREAGQDVKIVPKVHLDHRPSGRVRRGRIYSGSLPGASATA